MTSTIRNIFDTASLPHEDIDRLYKVVVPVNVAKGAMLIRKGQRCDHFYIIEKGFAQIFSVIDDKKTTTLFARENDIITSTYALFTQKSSNESIEILEDSVLLKIHYEEFLSLCSENPTLLNLYRSLMEKYYLSLEERTLSLQFDSALERYRKLLSRHPFILQRAPLGAIASFLGMSPVTLSRMRAQI